MENLPGRPAWHYHSDADPELLLSREWLVTNGLGGYASGTIAGVNTRRYHGLLVAALPAPHGRIMMFNHLSEQLQLPDATIMQLMGEQHADGKMSLHGIDSLVECRLEAGFPVWQYRLGAFVIEKRIFLPHGQNTVYINYRMCVGEGVIQLRLSPALHFRLHEASVGDLPPEPYTFTSVNNRHELSNGTNLPPLRLYVYGEKSAFTVAGKIIDNALYPVEERRGYTAVGHLWNPGYVRVHLSLENEATLVASTESWETILALPPSAALLAARERCQRCFATLPPAAHSDPVAALVLAADQFIITPVGRLEAAARARAAGDEVRTVIAGYHWFTDWGRDTMISLEGLTLTSGRTIEAGWILRTFAQSIRDGLIPNLFPEGEREGLYHTADATLWFFHAIDRYLTYTNDRVTLKLVLPSLLDIVEHHLVGTHFGIGVDSRDGLLRQGQEGYQLTWMDAKVDDWVVTPRRGKAVEINALWYNALRLLEAWVREEQGDEAAQPLARHATRCRTSFNQRFWSAQGGYLYDVVDGAQGDDPACRPNQLLAISLRHPVLDQARWAPVLAVVSERLLTPVGLRSLDPHHVEYQPKYDGDLRARDAAYHQGTVWAWLIGPFVDAWLKVHPHDRAGARRFLEGFVPHLGEAGLGTISEIFDAEPPYAPRGCIAQAWSVAEVLRCLVNTAEEASAPQLDPHGTAPSA
jgi:predicted glycogen debranching enzyme